MGSKGTRFAEISETTSFLHYFIWVPDHHWAGKADYPLPEAINRYNWCNGTIASISVRNR